MLAKVKALKAQRHKQVFSTAPIDDILKLLETPPVPESELSHDH